MLDLEKRYEDGTLNSENIDEWVSRDSPKKVYKIMQDCWQVYIKPPSITTDCAPSYEEDFEKGCVSFEITEIKNTKNAFNIIGRKMSLDHSLRCLLGALCSLYFSYKLKPENFGYDFSFCQPKGCNWKTFFDYVSINSQRVSIGEIGIRTIERRLGIYDPVKDYELLEFLFKKKDENFSRESKKPREVIKKDVETFLQREADLMDNCLIDAVGGTAQHFVANCFESEYEGRLPQLIRRELKPEKKYLDFFNTFTKGFMPNFRAVLEVETSSMKK